MKPICVKCQRFYKIVKSGLAFIEGMPIGEKVKAGTAEPEKWKPYKLWMGDLWECPDCHAQTISGVGINRVAEHYEPDFEQKAKQAAAMNPHGKLFQVNDC